MHILTDEMLEKALDLVASTRGLAGLSPLLLEGEMGVGKRHQIRRFVRRLCCSAGGVGDGDCKCLPCMQVEPGAAGAADYRELSCAAPIATVRDVVTDWVRRPSTALPYRVLVLHRLERSTDATTDTFLNLVEDAPGDLRILATTRSATLLPTTLSNRFQRLRHRSLSVDHVQHVMAGSWGQAAARGHNFPFRSIAQAQIALELDLEARFKDWFLGAEIAGLEERVLAVERAIDGMADRSASDVLDFVSEWFHWRVLQHCEAEIGRQPALARTKALLPSVTKMHQVAASRYRHLPNARGYISPRHQLYGYISSLAMLRRITTN